MAPEESENLYGYEKISKRSHESWAKFKKREREREKHMEKGEATLEAENLKSHI